MVGIFETPLSALFQGNLKKAKATAIQEASVTNAVMLIVNSIHVRSNLISFQGQTPRKLFLSRLTDSISTEIEFARIKVSNFGNFHTTWGNVVKSSAPIGFLNLYAPFEIIEYASSSEDSNIDQENKDSIVLCIHFKRIGESLPQEIFGKHLCNNCGSEINIGRLRAEPDALFCVSCQKIIEERRK